jgi:drug/metabolite transporter (DMT)-like permease
MVPASPYIVMIVAAFLFTLIIPLVKRYPVHISYHILIINAVTVAIVIVLNNIHTSPFSIKNIDDFVKDRARIVVGGLFTLYTVFILYGYSHVPMNVALPIFMTTPFVILFGSRYINGTVYTRTQFTLTLLCLVGVIMVTYGHIPYRISSYTGIFSLVLASLGYGLAYVFLKQNDMNTTISNPVLEKMHKQILDLSLIPMIFTILYIIVKQPSRPSLQTIGILIVAYILLSYVAQMGYLYAFNNIPIGNFGIMLNVEIIAALLLGVLT